LSAAAACAAPHGRAGAGGPVAAEAQGGGARHPALDEEADRTVTGLVASRRPPAPASGDPGGPAGRARDAPLCPACRGAVRGIALRQRPASRADRRAWTRDASLRRGPSARSWGRLAPGA